MKTFEQFLESKQYSSQTNSSRMKAVVELGDAIRKAFSKMTRNQRKVSWQTLTSKKGEAEIKRLQVDPFIPLNRLRKLATEKQ